LAPLERFSVEPPLVWPGQALSPSMPEAQGESEAWFFDCRVPQKHFVFRDSEAVFGPFSRRTFGRRGAYRGDQGRVSPSCDGGVFHGVHLLCDRLNHPVLQSRYFLIGYRLFGPSVA
jgi:hypothetical protein